MNAASPLRFLALLLGSALASAPAHAKDLRDRVGVGFNSWAGGGSLTNLSVRWGLPTTDPVRNVQFEGNLGLNTSLGGDLVYAGGRLLYGVVAEDNMNLYVSGGAGTLFQGGDLLVRVQPGLTADFFLFGLENLGFTGGFGANLDLGKGGGVTTSGAAMGGFHYWF